MKIEPKYVTYPNAVLLKEKGFNVECKSAFVDTTPYSNESKEFIDYLNQQNHNKSEHRISAPEHWQVIEWFRLKYGIHIFTDFGIGWEANIVPVGYQGDSTLFDNGFICLKNNKTVDEATEAAIEYCLKNLI
jgi:hypothetical protein